MDKEQIQMHEYEKIAFLDEASHDRISALLAEQATDLGQDDKTSYFFVLPDMNLSVASKSGASVIKLKTGQIGRGIGHVELPEVELAGPEQTNNAVELLTELTGYSPELSEQIRHNYLLNEVEIAVKYTETWGFHAELEYIYEGGSDDVIEQSKKDAESRINTVAGMLGITLATDSELITFTEKFEADRIPRGEYSSESVRKLYDSLHKRALLKRMPEQQFLDAETVDWIAQNRPLDLPNEGSKLLLSQEEKDIVANAALPTEWFSNDERALTIHGQLHHFRTAVFAATIARQNGATESQAKTVFVAGLVHDIARTHDKDDPTHAIRSAEWFKENYKEVKDSLGKYMRDVSADEVSAIIEVHDGAMDNASEELIDLKHILRTADALDRYRLPKLSWWIRDEYLKSKPTTEMKTTAFDVVVSSENEMLASRNVKKATQQILRFCEGVVDAT